MRTIIVGVALTLLASDVGAKEAQKMWAFDGDKPGAIAKGFVSEAGDWKVIADETAPSKSNVLAQLAKSPSATFNIALIGGTEYKDLRLSVMLKPIAGSEDQGGGLVWRAKDAKNYYIARWNPLEDNFRVYKVVNGRRSQLDGADIKAPAAWHVLEIEMVGSHIECSLDGRKHLDLKDSTFPEGGKIGVWTKSDAQTHFDDLKAEPAGIGKGGAEKDEDND
jgi:hypothetical protein